MTSLETEATRTAVSGRIGRWSSTAQPWAERQRTQPLGLPSAGCVFRNPPDLSAGWLIDQAGLKGARVGDAQISEKHANFIVNLGQAKAAHVLALIELAQDRVEKIFRVTLELELEVVVR
ncbi:MAG: hypothetical protein ACK40H_02465 [Sphingomonadaceae bacterium]